MILTCETKRCNGWHWVPVSSASLPHRSEIQWLAKKLYCTPTAECLLTIVRIQWFGQEEAATTTVPLSEHYVSGQSGIILRQN